jgi:hypothetical protein
MICKKSEADIIDKEVSGLIRKLIGFFGSDTINQRLSKYELSLKSSGPVYRDYYLKQRHPWWEALTRYFELDKRGKSIWKNLSSDINSHLLVRKVSESR